MVAPPARCLLLVVFAELVSQQNVCGCTSTVGASFLNASLERCLQRCRDSVVGCERIAYNSVTTECIVDVGQAGCGAGWTLHTPNISCGYGRGLVSGTCTICAKGRASHAHTGDLAGLWNLKTTAGSSAGQLQVTGGGLATYSDGVQGQFVLFHTRADPRYPGAFFLKQNPNTVLESSAGSGIGWEYAWLEDIDNGTIQLVVRRFCGSGPALCAANSSPEGSPFFVETLLGTPLLASGATPCPLLDGSVTGGIKGLCCQAVESVSGSVDSHYSGSFSVGTQSWQDVSLVTAAWNSAISLSAMKALQASSLVVVGSELCQGASVTVSLNNAVVFALRGSCEFAEKAVVAQQAGALAIIIINSESAALPPSLGRTNYPQDPSIPTWMIDYATGSAISSEFQTAGAGTVTFLGKKSSADDSALKQLCCEPACTARVAAAETRAGVPGVVETCATVDCAGFLSQVPATPSPLPQSDGTCADCESGLASTVEGRANCGPCYSGGTSGQGGSQCVPCAAGRAGSRGQCFECPAGQTADSLSITCITIPTPPPPPTPAPTPPPPPPTSPPTPAPLYTGPDRYAPSTVGSGTADDGGVPWGVIIGITAAVLVCCGCSWMGYRVYAAHADAIEEHGAAGALGRVLGVQGFSEQGTRSEREDAETGKSGNKKTEDKGDVSAGKQKDGETAGGNADGGGGKGKSMTIGGMKINFA